MSATRLYSVNAREPTTVTANTKTKNKIKAMTDSFNLAAIDIGSNAARLLIKSVTRQDDGTLQFQKLQFVRVPLRLGLDVFSQGKISQEREAQLLRTIKAFRQLMIIYNIVDYRACATAALRDARNGSKVIRRIKHVTSIPIDIITGEEEARTIYDNHIEKLLITSANAQEGSTAYLYVDVGGGSTEVTCIAGGQLIESRSFNIGTLRMLSGTVSLESINEMSDQICAMLSGQTSVTIIGSGGNINKLFRLVPKKAKLKDRITVAQLERLHTQLSALSVEQRIREFDLRPDRADVIVPAAQIFLDIAHAAGAPDILVPTIGLADGIISKLAISI